MQAKVALLLFFCVASFSYGDSVQELIDKARKNNPEIRKIEKELKIQEKKAKVARKLFNPSISLTFGGRDAFEKPYRAVTFKISQKIPYPKKLDTIYQIETKNYEEKYFFLLSKKNEIIQKIYESVYRLWLIREKIKIYKKYIELTEKIKSEIEENFSYGDRLKFLIIVENLYKEKQSLLIDEKIEFSNIESLINDTLNDININLKIVNIDVTPETLLEEMKDKSPLLQSYRKRLERLSKSLKLSKMIYYPDLSLSLRTTPEDRLQDSFSVGIGVNIPIWRTIRQEQIVLEAQLKKVSIEEEIRYIENLLRYQLLSSYYRIKKNRYIYNLINNSLKSKHGMNIQISKMEFLEGKRDISDLIIAIRDSLNSEIEAVESIYNTNVEYINIKALLGEL
ncbi:MAG TPA: TolC family protein [Persephonella sp.]|uniref:TolC family protein n=1 Tax=Persephonella TaxID=182899 RepID=UPI0005A2F9D2|nr:MULTISPECIES: TolC family protein [Persephonella]HCB69168.1 TolC family protein [Persephonella sp.]